MLFLEKATRAATPTRLPTVTTTSFLFNEDNEIEEELDGAAAKGNDFDEEEEEEDDDVWDPRFDNKNSFSITAIFQCLS